MRTLGERPVGAVAYATAWAARLMFPDGQPVFPGSRQWLLERQHADGAWGGSVFHPQDRLVCTLAAVLALHHSPDHGAGEAVQRGASFVESHSSEWSKRLEDMIGFELIAPYLVGEATSAGLITGTGYEELASLRSDKLAQVPTAVLRERATTFMYSLEALGDIISMEQAAAHAGESGSIVNSPAATAALWAATANPAALGYLREASGSTGSGGMPETYPIDVFEPAWTLYLLGRAALLPPGAAPHLARLVTLARTAHQGLGWSQQVPVPDSDCTAMAATVLRLNGHDDTALLKALRFFETPTHYIGYPHERGIAITANAHVLEALAYRPDLYRAQIDKALAALLDERRDGAWWIDKWHLSPYYATAQVCFALTEIAPYELPGTLRWLLGNQHADGSWGSGPTPGTGLPEETAYAVLALDAIPTCRGAVPSDVYNRAHSYLREHLDDPHYAEIWIGKALYTPGTVVRTTVLAGYAISARNKGVS